MSGQNWTPGPWRVDPRCSTHVETFDGRGICSTGGYHDNARNSAELADEHTASAALIAAAPEMAELLGRIASGPMAPVEWIQSARALLATLQAEPRKAQEPAP